MATEFAPAKINLTLHVTGRRADGYHLLDSLVAFAGVGDRITAEASDGLKLHVSGPMAAGLAAPDQNLCLRAAGLFGAGRGASILLEKNLPVASGIGGGSSDAAATLRALSRLWGLPLPSAEDVLSLGADVPVCLHPQPVRMTGIGEALTPVSLPEAWLVLANPGQPVPTAEVFRGLMRSDNAAMPDPLPPLPDAAALAAFLHQTRNDLETPACGIAPVIGVVLAALGTQPGCLIARMSGSGATCFGLFAAAAEAAVAVETLRQEQPGWWIEDAKMIA